MRHFPEINASSRVMVVAPHPDDEVLAVGGLICTTCEAGAAICIIFLTSGDNNPWPQRAIERRWRIGETDRLRWGTRRHKEALQALAALNVSENAVCFLNYPDQGFTAMLMRADEKPADELARLIEEFHPTLLITPSLNDLHPDHSAAAAYIHQVISLGYISPDLQWFEYLIHSSNHQASMSGDITLALNHDQVARKRAAISCHKSQTALRPGLLSFAERDEVYHLVAENAEPHYPFHPVYYASIEKEHLCLKLRRSSSCRAFGSRSLCFVVNQKGCAKGRFIMSLSSWPSRTVATIRDAPTRNNVGLGYLLRRGRETEIQIALHVFGAIDQLFVKLERRFGFLDEAGWREIPL
jgi:LmbE family N-acetylglucosaminyl deacetylase